MSQLYLIFHHPSSWLDFYIFSIMTFTWQVVLNLVEAGMLSTPTLGPLGGVTPEAVLGALSSRLHPCITHVFIGGGLFENPPKQPHQAFPIHYFMV